MRGGKEGETRREAVACCQLGITTLAGMKCGVVFSSHDVCFFEPSVPSHVQLFSSVCPGGVCDWGHVIVTWTGHGSLRRGW